MGQISRINRTGRFLEEFEEDLRASSQFKVGQTLTITGIHYLPRELSGEEAVEVIKVQDKNGEEHYLESDRGILFDPESWDDHDTVDALIHHLGITLSHAQERLKRARLFD